MAIEEYSVNGAPVQVLGDFLVTACWPSERAPGVIWRKNTNSFGSMWAGEGDCAVRTVADTANSPADLSQTIIATAI